MYPSNASSRAESSRSCNETISVKHFIESMACMIVFARGNCGDESCRVGDDRGDEEQSDPSLSMHLRSAALPTSRGGAAGETGAETMRAEHHALKARTRV